MFASYFAGVMVRLILTLTPCVCIAAAIAISSVMESYLKPSAKELKEKTTMPLALKAMISIPVGMVLVLFAWHCAYVTSSSYSSPSVVLAYNDQRGDQVLIDDFREAYYWLRQNVYLFD